MSARRAAVRALEHANHRLTPAGTRRATFIERSTVARLSWERLTKANRGLEVVGRLTTALFVVFAVSGLLGRNWRRDAADVFNSGHPLSGAVVVVTVFLALGFVALRSVIGFARWRVQRELWRREVAALTARAQADD